MHIQPASHSYFTHQREATPPVQAAAPFGPRADQADFKRPRFSANPAHPEDGPGWWRTIVDFLSGFVQPFSPKSPFKFKADDPIADGTLIASGVQHPRQAFERLATIDRHEIIPQSPMMLTAIRVDRRIDRTLTQYLESEELKRLKAQAPSATASPEAEMKFLRRLNASTNRQFDHAGRSHGEQIDLSDRDSYQAYRDRMEKYIEDGATGKKPSHHTSRLLGHSMRQGVGVCRHRSLLTALSVREMNVRDLKATYTMGVVKDLLDRDSDFTTAIGTHVWNVVTVPSGRKYVVDSINDVVLPSRKIDGQKYPLSYASFEHIFKHGNPNFKKPSSSYTSENAEPFDDSGDSSFDSECYSDSEFQPRLKRVRTSLTM